MKKYALSFIFLIGLSIPGFAQGYISFPDSNAVWVNGYSTLYPLPFYHYELEKVFNYCAEGNDTIINAVSYKQINYCDSIYKGALRDDNGKVYYVPADSAHEFLLYDFTLEEGDTLGTFYYEAQSTWPTLSTEDFIISFVDSTLINGVYRKRIDVNSGWWIEGMGCNQGLFSEPYINVSNYSVELLCMSHGDTVLYPNVSFTACEPMTVGLNESPAKPGIYAEIYPNPAGNVVSVETAFTACSFQLHNVDGKLLLEGSATAQHFIIDLSDVALGVHILTLVKDEERMRRMIVKQWH